MYMRQVHHVADLYIYYYFIGAEEEAETLFEFCKPRRSPTDDRDFLLQHHHLVTHHCVAALNHLVTALRSKNLLNQGPLEHMNRVSVSRNLNTTQQEVTHKRDYS